ncbi:GTP-binding protein EngB [Chitinispirillum alkaliphilum]|nr:GTP-binding protein EngB [Chitinispirillum alkaliphilum]
MSKEELKRTPKAVFVCSSAHFKDMPESDDLEYAIVGRSNVGKSSFINHVLESGSIARTSKKPGKTTLANFYRLEDNTVWVDLPGYGYARAPIKEKQRWSRLIGDYCSKRKNLVGLIWLLDIRHPGNKVDCEAWNWLYELDIPVFPVLTKSDKLSKSNEMKSVAEYKRKFGFTVEPVRYSVMKHSSRENFWDNFRRWRESVTAGSGDA